MADELLHSILVLFQVSEEWKIF